MWIDLEHVARNAGVVEVAGPLCGCRNVHFHRRVVWMLVHVLVASPEEQLVLVLVEMREEHGTANVAADIVELLRVDLDCPVRC